MSLELNEQMVLPDGIHESCMDELRSVFGGFKKSTRRIMLCDKLNEYLNQLKSAHIASSVIVDGSFVMGAVDEPEDIDIILILDENWDMSTDIRPFQYNLVSKKDVKRNFPFDLYVVRADSEEEENWINFFSKVNVKWYNEFGFPDGATKGLVRIMV